MKADQVRAIAVQRGINPGKMKKSDMIRSIQNAEGNEACFDTGRSRQCGQQDCLWRADCN